MAIPRPMGIVTSAPTAVDGVPSSAKKGGRDGKAKEPVMKKKEEKKDVSFAFPMDSIPLCLLYLKPKLSIALGAQGPPFSP